MRFHFRTLLIVLAVGPTIIGVRIIVVRKAYLDAVAIANRRVPERAQS
jgi:hypothetical protein